MLSSIFTAKASWLSLGNYDISWYNANDNEYSIATPQQLAGIAYLVNNGYTTFNGKTIKLSQDISLASNDWIAIGIGQTQPFQGVFDGLGHKISGLTISHKSNTYYGIWAYISYATIKNLQIEGNSSFFYQDGYYPELYLGAIAGYANNSNIQNCSADFPIIYDREKTESTWNWDSTYDIYMGGIVGYATNTYISHCSHYGNISMKFGTGISEHYSDDGGAYIGGICGKSYHGRTEYCGHSSEYISATVSHSVNADYFSTYIGGIIGHVSGTNIVGCYNNTEKFIGEFYGLNTNYRSIFFGGITSSASFWNFEPYGELTNCYSSTNIIEFYRTWSSFSGICGCNFNNAPTKYSANFSPADIYINRTDITPGFSGSTTFTKEQMKETTFLNELNLYPIINNCDYRWEMGNTFPQITNPYNAGVTDIKKDTEKIEISTFDGIIKLNKRYFVQVYSINGILKYQGETESIENIGNGFHILKIGNKTYKIIL